MFAWFNFSAVFVYKESFLCCWQCKRRKKKISVKDVCWPKLLNYLEIQMH